MNIITYSLLLSQHKTSKSHIIALTALLMMLIDPFIIYDSGAHLSFLATMALLFGVPAIENAFPEKIPAVLRQVLLSLAPILFTSPLLWYMFNTYHPSHLYLTYYY